MAVILHSKKIMFVHISKNGGTSISHFLRQHSTDGDITIMEGGLERKPAGRQFHTRFHISKHAPAYNFKSWFGTTGLNWDEYKSLAVIRDPEERVHSVFNMLGRGGQHWGPYLAGPEWWGRYQRCRSVDEFVTSGLYDPDGANFHTRTQRSFVTNPSDTIIVSDLVALENIEQIPDILGLDGKMPRVNGTNKPKRKLGREALQLLQDKYAVDYELHGSVAKW